ncbi:MAG: nitroreductase family protein [Acidobacteriia bacterium]|nr:nitroreductase family protein [Terriglobia bacterium]
MDVMEAIRRRRSVREYRSDPIPADVLERVTEALRLAPSACNYQPWRFVLVTEPKLRAEVAAACHEQLFVAEAPVVVVGCALPETAYKRMGERWNSADVDVAVAIDHLTLAAVAEGLGTCWIGSYDEGALRRLLGVPEEAKIVALTPLGYPRHPSLLQAVKPGDRKPRSEVFSSDHW